MSLNLSSNFLQFKIEMAKPSRQGVYEFDGFRLDAAKLMLYRDGQEISLPPKTIETLAVLVENHGEIVAKNDLMDRLWADAAVEESNLSQYLYLLRKTLGTQADGKPYIETFRRRGYRFNGEVHLVEAAPIKNGSAPPQQTSPPRYEVERRGNVLTLADWRETENALTQIASDDGAANNRLANDIVNDAIATVAPSSVAAPKQFPIGKAATIAAVAVVFLASLFYARYKFTPSAENAAHEKGELTITRLTNGGEPKDATISPDGNYFVYHEQDGATAHVWLQQTGSSNRVEIIPPSEKTIYGKTFSPDGAFVYFLARDNADAPFALYRVPTLGGAASKVLDDINSPVSFSPSGKEMVFARFNNQTRESALIVAPADGGDEKVLLSRTSEQGTLGMPAWSPDGNLIAFGAVNFPTSQQGSMVILGVNPQTGETLSLSPERWDTCYRMVWTRDGQGLIFIGTKAREAYSTRRDQIYYLSYPKGESRRLTTDGSRHDVLSLGITNNDEIVAIPFNRASQIWQMNPNGDSRTAVQITEGLADGRAGLAPLADGRVGYIARSGDTLNVWLMNADGANQKQITRDPPTIEELRAAPNGRFFVFAAVSDGRSHLFLMDADGGRIRQLTFGDSSEVDSTVSPDGNWIAYDSVVFNGGDYKTSLWKISSAGGEPVLLADKECNALHFSPDGKTLSCVYREKEISVLSAEDGTTLKTFEAVKTPRLNVGARWSPDGRALVYIVQQKNFSNLWRQPINGGAAQPLTDFTSGDIYNFAFSPDGSRLYVARGYPIRDAVLIKNFK